MSDTDNRKSMDDVLASIRRIVRSEKEPNAEPEVAAPSVVSPDDMDGPLELTPDMRMDPAEGAPEAPAVTPFDAPAPAPEHLAGSSLDEEAIRNVVREVLLEMLQDSDAGDLVRGIIREELVNGEIGGNISQNVMAMIQSEVSKAVQK